MPLGMLVTYEKHEGLPRDASLTCTYENREIALRRVGKEFHFRTGDRVVSSDTDINRLFAKWIEDHDRPEILRNLISRSVRSNRYFSLCR
jgi:hypothetical protein